MNGAETLVGTLLKGNVNVCFTNPGTSEMHFVAALDDYKNMRSILCLFEGCATGAADGYFRMKRTPASTLLHLGPGLANGLSNLHNAKKANSGIVNIVGEHALDHIKLNAPLTSDIEGIARPVSSWVKTSKSSKEIGLDAAEAIKVANKKPGEIATLILPGDTAWNEGSEIEEVILQNNSKKVPIDLIEKAIAEIQKANNPLLLVGGSALEKNNLINKVGFKDLGAGGVACASIELADAAGLGAEVWVDKIHTSMPELDGHIILCSETQERFMWACPKHLTQTILDHYNVVFDFPNVSVGAQASIVGKIIDEKHYTVYYKNKKIVDGPIEKINEGFVYDRPMSQIDAQQSNEALPKNIDYNNLILKILSHENVASRAVVYESYDKNVQGRVVNERGKTNAGVVAPFDSKRFPEEIKDDCFSATLAHNPSIGKIDPYVVAQYAIIEACAKTVSVGASPLAITDCLCFGNPEKPEQMWQFSQSCIAIRETCSLLHFNETNNLPIVAGNVSFYNQSGDQSIPASPMIGCFGRVVKDRVLMNGFKSSDANLYLLGETPAFAGGSIATNVLKINNTELKKIDVQKYGETLNCVLKANALSLINSCNYAGLGGLATTLFKMSFTNDIGCIIKEDIDKDLLFSENFSLVVEVSDENSPTFEEMLNKNKCTFKLIGKTNNSNKIVVKNFIDLDIAQSKKTWENALRKKLQ